MNNKDESQRLNEEETNMDNINNNNNNNTTITSHHENSNVTIYDSILEDYGYGAEIWKMIITSILLYLIAGFFSTSLPSFMIAYKEILQVSDNDLNLLGTIFFISKGFGSIITGEVTIFISRERLIRATLLLLLIMNFLIDLSSSFLVFCLFKVITGALTGIIEILANNILCEYLPITYRSFTLNAVWMGYNLSQLLTNLIMIMTMPNMEPSGVGPTNLLFSVIIFICFVLSFVIMRDSPRNLILHNKEEEAFEVLYKLKDNSFYTQEVKIKIVKEIKEKNVDVEHTNKYAKIFDVFSREYLYFSIISIVVSVGGTALNDGGILLTSITLKQLNIENGEEASKGIVFRGIIVYSVVLFSNIFYGIISELKIIGRKNSIFLGISINIFCLVFIVLFPAYITISISFFNFFSNVINLISVYCSEVYPTKIRDIGSGWNNLVSYIGSALCQYFLLYMFKSGWRVPYFYLISISVVSAVLICFSPVETKDRPLDCKINNLNENGENIHHEKHDKEEKEILLNKLE